MADMTFVRNMRRLMFERGWSQKRLGIESGVAQSTVSAVMTGARRPTLPTLRRIKAALGCTWDEMLE